MLLTNNQFAWSMALSFSRYRFCYFHFFLLFCFVSFASFRFTLDLFSLFYFSCSAINFRSFSVSLSVSPCLFLLVGQSTLPSAFLRERAKRRRENTRSTAATLAPVGEWSTQFRFEKTNHERFALSLALFHSVINMCCCRRCRRCRTIATI